jgi:hypothetical protein
MNEPWQQFIPYWLRTAVPFGIDPGLLSRPVGQATENSWPTPSPSVLLDGGLLGNLNRSWDQSGGDGRILGSLASPPNGQDQGRPYWLQTAMPFGMDFGLPALQAEQPWATPPANQSLLPTPDPSTLPTPSAFPPIFPSTPPLPHLDSAKYWGTASAPSGTSAPPPAHGFYLSPMPPAPNWDQVPTQAANGLTQMFPPPPSPSLWDVLAPAVSAARASPSAEFADANGANLRPPLSAANPPDGAATATSPQPRPIPSQRWPSAPPVNPDEGPWASGSLGRAPSDPRIISDVLPDNDWKPGAQYAQGRGGRGSIPIFIRGQRLEADPGQAARFIEAQTRAQTAVARLRQLDPNWRPQQSVQSSDFTVESAIRAYEAEAEQARARIRELTRFQTEPIVPKERPETAKERNDIAREIAKWVAKNQEKAVEGANWLFEYEPSVQAYLDPPKTLEELQQSVTTPKPGYDIHHVVEKTPAEEDGFSKDIIHGPENLVRIPRFKHWEITSWYMTKNKDYEGLSPRDYLRGKDWATRTEIGLRALIENGVLSHEGN